MTRVFELNKEGNHIIPPQFYGKCKTARAYISPMNVYYAEMT